MDGSTAESGLGPIPVCLVLNGYLQPLGSFLIIFNKTFQSEEVSGRVEQTHTSFLVKEVDYAPTHSTTKSLQSSSSPDTGSGMVRQSSDNHSTNGSKHYHLSVKYGSILTTMCCIYGLMNSFLRVTSLLPKHSTVSRLVQYRLLPCTASET